MNALSCLLTCVLSYLFAHFQWLQISRRITHELHLAMSAINHGANLWFRILNDIMINKQTTECPLETALSPTQTRARTHTHTLPLKLINCIQSAERLTQLTR